MRIIDVKEITNAVAKLCAEANIYIGEDVRNALIKAKDAETHTLAQSVLDTLLTNLDIAEQEGLPICQDTGMAVVFISIGMEVYVQGDIEVAINEGVRRGYRNAYGRNSIVCDPIRRTNTGDNTPAVVHYAFMPGENLEITVAPKGFGSENMSGIKMLNPSDGLEGVENFVIQQVEQAGANPCPPIVVGVGVGGTMEKAAILAKRALLRDIGTSNPNAFWAESEAQMLARINHLNIGPAGFGGKTTALGVHVETFPTHIAGLPVAVNINCHVARHKTVII